MSASSSAKTSTAAVPARAALAGNPSDGYGGGVVATVVPGMTATVTVQPASWFRVGGVEFEQIGDIPRGERLGDATEVGDAALFLAAIAVANQRWPVSPCTIDWSTSIPRSVGLAGSSALVLATLNALADANHQTIAAHDLPMLALEAEQLLGITAGLQDRVAQSFGGTQSMTFPGTPPFTQRSLQPACPLDLVVLWDTTAAEPSQRFHGELRRRYDDGEAAVHHAMSALADAAQAAEEALETGNHEQLGAAMGTSFALRSSISDLSPSHVALVDLARSHDVPANYAGSGGAVIGLLSREDSAKNLARSAKEKGLGFHRWKVSEN